MQTNHYPWRLPNPSFSISWNDLLSKKCQKKDSTSFLPGNQAANLENKSQPVTLGKIHLLESENKYQILLDKYPYMSTNYKKLFQLHSINHLSTNVGRNGWNLNFFHKIQIVLLQSWSSQQLSLWDIENPTSPYTIDPTCSNLSQILWVNLGPMSIHWRPKFNPKQALGKNPQFHLKK